MSSSSILRAAACAILVIVWTIAPAWAQDSDETMAEQAVASASEQNPGSSFPILSSPERPEGLPTVAGPLFIGVDDVTVAAQRVDVVTNDFATAFIGAQVWGAAYDPVQDRVLFNDGSTLQEWPVGGAVNSLGSITDVAGGPQSMTGLAFHNGTLYGCKNIANEAIYSIDTTTLVATVFIDYEDADFDCGGLAVDPASGSIYMTNDDTTPSGAGLYRINPDGSGTLITAYPDAQTDIDGLAIGDGRAYLVTDEPGSIYVWDFDSASFVAPLDNPWTTAETFSAGAWIPQGSGYTFTVNKAFSDGNPTAVDVTVECTGVDVEAPATRSVTPGVGTSWNLIENGAEQPTGVFAPTCTATESNVPAGYTNDTGDACTAVDVSFPEGGSCTLINTQIPVTLTIAKSYSEAHPVADPEVEITLTCESANVEGEAGSSTVTTVNGYAGFEVSEFLWNGSACFATETVPAGYVQDTTNDSCGLDLANPGVVVVPGGTQTPEAELPTGNGPVAVNCSITNRPTEALFTVDKNYSDSNPVLAAAVTPLCTDAGGGPGITYLPASGNALHGTNFATMVKYFAGATNCTASELDQPGYSFVADSSTCDEGVAITDAADGSCVIFNDQDPIEIQAAKIYSNGGGAAVEFAVECTNLDAGGTVLPPTAAAAPGSPAVFTVNDVMWDGSTLCSVSEPTPPAGYTQSANTCTTGNLDMTPDSDDPRTCAITNSLSRATFRVTKFFDDGNNVDEVTVSIDCNTGLILDQDKLLSDNEWVEFVVTDYTDGTLTCTITEDGEAGYSGEYFNVTLDITNDESCEYNNIGGGETAFACEITNSPDPVDIVVIKEWVIEGTANAIDWEYQIDLYCEASGMTGSNVSNSGGNSWQGSNNSEGDDTFVWSITPLFPTSACYASETSLESYVEVENGCSNLEASAGNGVTCTITNTVFFEGIPTLSQYGMALLALLMLGVGMVGFRRHM